MLEKEFSKIGLNNNEREVYLAVLRAGKVSPIRVAKETGINRTTVYSIARKLEKFGLITEEVGSKASYLYANKPESLHGLFHNEEVLLKEKQDLAKYIVDELKKIPSQSSYSVPKIKFIEEDDLSEYLYKQHNVWMQSAISRDAMWWGYHDSSVTKTYPDWIHWSWKQPLTKNVTVNFFSNEVKEEKDMNKTYEERHTKVLPTGVEVDSSTWIAGDYTIMVQTRSRPHYLVEICDPVFARNQREFFKCLWGMSGSDILS